MSEIRKLICLLLVLLVPLLQVLLLELQVLLLLVLLLVRQVLLVPLQELLQELQFFLRSQQMRLSLQERGIQKTFSLLCLFCCLIIDSFISSRIIKKNSDFPKVYCKAGYVIIFHIPP